MKKCISCEATKEHIHKDFKLSLNVCVWWREGIVLLIFFPGIGVKTMFCQQGPGWFINFFSLHARELSLTPEVLTPWPTLALSKARGAIFKIAEGNICRYFLWWGICLPALLPCKGARCMKKIRDLYPKQNSIWVPSLPLSSCVKLGKLVNCYKH